MPSDCSPGMGQQAADIGLLNFKHGFDLALSRDHQSILDNQEDARAWAQLKLRAAQNGATFDHFVNMTSSAATAAAMQTGQTENDQTVSPVRTGTGDAIVGGVGVSAEQVAANVADLATSLVPVLASALATAISQTLAAVLPVVVTASGGASTPSQTSSKPTGS
jgi:hypothetical protein